MPHMRTNTQTLPCPFLSRVVCRYEWVMTPKYDPKNALHNEIKKGIEVGDALPDLITQEEVRDTICTNATMRRLLPA